MLVIIFYGQLLHKSVFPGTEEESSDKHSSDEPDGDDIDTSSVWPITQEQREYYAAQFKSLQPNPEGLLAGSIAR